MQVLKALLTRWRPRPPVQQVPLVLEGVRVFLRPVEAADAEHTFFFVSDPMVTRFLPWQPANDIETVRAFLVQQQVRREKGESLAFSIILRETGEVIGSTDLMQLRSVAPPTAELGYILAQKHWGKGFMSEAAALSRDYAFHTLKRRLLLGYADQENLASRRVLEKIGMKEAGSEWRTVKEQTRLYVRYELQRPFWEENFS